MSDPKALGAEIHMHYPPNQQDDDFIDLFGIAQVLWQQKWLVAAVTAVAVAIAALALVLMTPTYKAEIFLRPPLDSQITQLNDTNLVQFTKEQAFYSVTDELQSFKNQRAIFDAVKSGFLHKQTDDETNWDNIFVDKFASSISTNISRVDEKKGNFDVNARLTFSHWNPELVATVANALADSALENARLAALVEIKGIATSKLDTLNASLQQQLTLQQNINKDEIIRLSEADKLNRQELRDKIAAVKDTAAKERQDEIQRLEEAFKIAARLNIEEPTSLSLWSQRSSGSTASVAVTTDVSDNSEPIYLRGTRALGAELEVLKARSSDDYATPELRGLEQELQLLENNRRAEQLAQRTDFAPYIPNIDEIRAEIAQLEGVLAHSYDSVALARIDQRAIVPTRPESPRKALTLALALILGGFLGCAIALIRNAAANRRAPRQLEELMPPLSE
jgi:LPS O-antigen subunit length determinant protein (WzzB/FepE family)